MNIHRVISEGISSVCDVDVYRCTCTENTPEYLRRLVGQSWTYRYFWVRRQSVKHDITTPKGYLTSNHHNSKNVCHTLLSTPVTHTTSIYVRSALSRRSTEYAVFRHSTMCLAQPNTNVQHMQSRESHFHYQREISTCDIWAATENASKSTMKGQLRTGKTRNTSNLTGANER